MSVEGVGRAGGASFEPSAPSGQHKAVPSETARESAGAAGSAQASRGRRPGMDGPAADPDGAALAARIGDLLERGQGHEARAVLAELAVTVRDSEAQPAAAQAAGKRLSDLVVKLAADGKLGEDRCNLYAQAPSAILVDDLVGAVRAGLLGMGTDEAKAAWPPLPLRGRVVAGWAPNFEYKMSQDDRSYIRAMTDRLAYTDDLTAKPSVKERANQLSDLIVALAKNGKLAAFKEMISDSDGFLIREMGRALDKLGSAAAKAAWQKRP